MKEKDKNKEALLKFSIISPLITTPELYESNNAFFKSASEKEYVMDNGHRVNVSASTIERWYYIYKKKGFDGLVALKRCDCGKSRKLTAEIINEMEQMMANSPRLKAKAIYLQIGKNKVSYATINRLYKLLKNKNGSEMVHKQMLRYELPYANDVWCADSSAGPYLYKDKKEKIRLWIIALIDDASRMIMGCKIFENDNTINLMSTLKSAISVNGKPKVLNMDYPDVLTIPIFMKIVSKYVC